MASPKDGSAVSADAPEDPAAPLEATSTDPGELTQITARNRELKPATPDSVTVDPLNPPSGGGGGEEALKLSWISVELQDPDGKAVPNEPFIVIFSDNSKSNGITDDKGKCKLEGVPSGSAKIDFASIDKREWKKK